MPILGEALSISDSPRDRDRVDIAASDTFDRTERSGSYDVETSLRRTPQLIQTLCLACDLLI